MPLTVSCWEKGLVRIDTNKAVDSVRVPKERERVLSSLSLSLSLSACVSPGYVDGRRYYT